MPRRQHQIIALGAMLVLFAAIFGAERTREVIRKPDIIAGYMSSNQLVFNDIPARGVQREEQQLNETGMLGSLPFLPRPEMISVGATAGFPNHQVAMGRVLVIQQCAACHNVSNQTAITVFDQRLALRSLAQLLERRKMTTAPKIETYLKGIGAFPYMHPFVGTPEERAAMALYLEYFIQQQHAPQPQAQARR